MKWRLVAPIGLIVLTAGAMLYSHFADPHFPYTELPPDHERYGHNRAGHLTGGLVVVSIELASYLLLTQPWKEKPPLIGLALAMLVYIPWTAASLLGTMHTGGIFFIHFFWVLGLDLFVLAAIVARLRFALKTRSHG